MVDKTTYSIPKELRLTENEKRVYQYIIDGGAHSANELSKNLKLGRTVIYNSISNLIEKKLVVEIVEKNGRIFEANTPESLNAIVQEKKVILDTLEKSLPEIVDSLSLLSNAVVEESDIKFYTGQKGLEQITWNSTKAKDILRIYEIDDIDVLVGEDFADDTLIEYVKNKVFDKQLSNLKEMDNSTSIAEFIDNWWEARYIPAKQIEIQFETMIYNDVVCMYEYQDKEIFCVEIYNYELARTQKEIFDIIWDCATPLKKLNSYGRAIVDE